MQTLVLQSEEWASDCEHQPTYAGEGTMHAANPRARIVQLRRSLKLGAAAIAALAGMRIANVGGSPRMISLTGMFDCSPTMLANTPKLHR